MRRETAEAPDRGKRTGAFGQGWFGDGRSWRARAGMLAIRHQSNDTGLR